MSTIFEYKGRYGSAICTEDGKWYGRILNEDTLTPYFADTPDDLEKAFHYKLDALDAKCERMRNLVSVRNAIDELVNLQPHIPQSCLPGQAVFIDGHVDRAIEILRSVEKALER